MAQSNHRLVPARSGLPGESLAAPSVREPIDAHKRDMVAFGSYQGSRKRDRHPQSQGLYQTISGTIPEDDYWKQRHGKRTQQSQLQLQLDLQKKELEVERLKQLNEALRWQTSGSIDQVNQQSQQSREQSLLQSLLLLVAASPALNLAEMGAQINQVPVCGTQESAANSGLDLVAGLLKQLQHTSGTMDDQQKCSLGVPLPAGQVSGTAAPQSLSSSFQDSVVATTSSVTGNPQVQMVADALVQAAVDSIQAGLRATGGPGLAALVHAQGGANSLPSGQSTASCQLTGGNSQVPVAANLCVGPQHPAMPFSLINSQIPGAANLSLESQALLATKQPGQSQILAAGHVGAGMQMPAMTSMMNPTGVTSVWPGPQVPVAANLPSPQVPVAVNLPGAQVPFAVNYPNPQVQGAAGLFHPQVPGAVNLFDPQVQGAANLVNLPVQVAVNQPNQPQVPAAVNLPLGVVEIKVEDEGVPLPPSPMGMKMEDEGIPLPESPVGAEKDKETNTAEREEKGRGWLGLWCPGAGPGDPPSQFLPEPQFYPPLLPRTPLPLVSMPPHPPRLLPSPCSKPAYFLQWLRNWHIQNLPPLKGRLEISLAKKCSRNPIWENWGIPGLTCCKSECNKSSPCGPLGELEKGGIFHLQWDLWVLCHLWGPILILLSPLWTQAKGKLANFANLKVQRQPFKGIPAHPVGFKASCPQRLRAQAVKCLLHVRRGGRDLKNAVFCLWLSPGNFLGETPMLQETLQSLFWVLPPQNHCQQPQGRVWSVVPTHALSHSLQRPPQKVYPPLAALTPSESLPKFTPETLALFQGSLCPLGNTAKGLPSSGELFREPRLSGGPFWTPPSQLEDAPTLHGQHDGRTPPPPSWSLHLKPALNFSDRV